MLAGSEHDCCLVLRPHEPLVEACLRDPRPPSCRRAGRTSALALEGCPLREVVLTITSRKHGGYGFSLELYIYYNWQILPSAIAAQPRHRRLQPRTPGPAPRSRPYPPTPDSCHPPPSYTQSADYWQHTRKHHAHQRNTEARISFSCRPHPQCTHHTTPVPMPASRFG